MSHSAKLSKMLPRIIACIILALATLAPVFSLASLFPDDWDREFQSATDVFLPVGTDWRLLKAQCWQESRLQPLAVSPVGAFGLCQFMPGTAGDVGKAIGESPDSFWLPEVSIRAAGYYMGRLHRSWYAERPAMDRFMLAAASYNAGLGNIVKAQRLCDGKNLYKEVSPCLPQVTGRHSRETIGYVKNIIGKWYPMLLFN